MGCFFKAVFYQTEAGGGPVGEWLKSLASQLSHQNFRRPVMLPVVPGQFRIKVVFLRIPKAKVGNELPRVRSVK